MLQTPRLDGAVGADGGLDGWTSYDPSWQAPDAV